MADDRNKRDIPVVFEPVALQVALNMAIEGKLAGDAAIMVLAHAAKVNRRYDEWMRLALANAAMARGTVDLTDTMIQTDYNGVHQTPTVDGTEITRRAD